MLRVITAVLFASIMSCTTIKEKRTSVTKDSSSGIAESTIALSRGTGGITLLPHQLRPIDYLLKNPGIKGLLVNHYMGTGKTYLGIGVAQAFKKHPVIIVAPSFLESNWQTSIAQYGVHDRRRITFVSYDEAPDKLTTIDLKNHIVLLDEVHNLIKRMRSLNQQQNLLYTKVYMNLRQAHRILGLTGTPVYGDESDLAFMINLVSGKEVMPFNQEAFRLQYTSILPVRQFFRGYVLEGNMFTNVFPTILTLLLGAIFPPWGFFVGFPVGILGPVAIKKLTPLNTYKLRSLSTGEMKDILRRYVSYFRFDESEFKEFPAQDFRLETVRYNREQYSFFIRLVEGDLEVEHLKRLLQNEKVKLSDELIKINSSSLHEDLYRAIGAGRDIGNFEFINTAGEVIEPPKFLQILKNLREHDEQTVIYSNYYETGSLAFMRFLQRQGYEQRSALIHPGLSPERIGEIVQGYNSGETRVLILHPDVTEGISLKGTQYLHILEPIINPTVLEQVIGRTRRFRSHSHLPEDKRLVRVRVWQSHSSGWSTELGDIYRANWYKRYRELSYMSLWGIGVSQIDKKYDRKELNPEELTQIKLETLRRNLSEMQESLTKDSIESHYR